MTWWMKWHQWSKVSYEFKQKLKKTILTFYIYITEQAEDIEEIAENVHQTADSVEDGVRDLEKSEQYQQKFRKKLLIISSIVLLFVIAITVFLLCK